MFGLGVGMAQYRRPRITGATIFFTVALARHGSGALVQNIDLLRHAVRVTKRERPFVIEACVVLPDHLHCLWKLPPGDRDFSTRWRLIKTRFSKGLAKGSCRSSHELRQERGIWQRRFWEHHIRNAEDFRSHLEFCWFDPVKHGLAETPLDWPYSSIHRDRRYAGHKVRGTTHPTSVLQP